MIMTSKCIVTLSIAQVYPSTIVIKGGGRRVIIPGW